MQPPTVPAGVTPTAKRPPSLYDMTCSSLFPAGTSGGCERRNEGSDMNNARNHSRTLQKASCMRRNNLPHDREWTHSHGVDREGRQSVAVQRGAHRSTFDECTRQEDGCTAMMWDHCTPIIADKALLCAVWLLPLAAVIDLIVTVITC